MAIEHFVFHRILPEDVVAAYRNHPDVEIVDDAYIDYVPGDEERFACCGIGIVALDLAPGEVLREEDGPNIRRLLEITKISERYQLAFDIGFMGREWFCAAPYEPSFDGSGEWSLMKYDASMVRKNEAIAGWTDGLGARDALKAAGIPIRKMEYLMEDEEYEEDEEDEED